jgi:hypothetical protein
MSTVQPSPPPQLEPHVAENGSSAGSSLSLSSSGSYGSSLPHETIVEILFRILSKLTIYQSLQENSNMVVTVRDDLSMMDACSLFLPSHESASGTATDNQSLPTDPRSVSLMMVEVLESSSYSTRSQPQSPESKARTLFNIAKELKKGDEFSLSLLPELIEEEAKNTTRAAHRETPIGDFLTVRDCVYFIRFGLFGSVVPRNITVGGWIDFKRSIVLTGKDSDEVWMKFCTETMFVSRASVSLSHGAKEDTFYSGSSMNMSVSNLLSFSGRSPDSLESMFAPRTGGSCLHAVSELLARPWQNSLPLSVSTEKGIHAIFGYTSLPQMMAHVAMNCSEQSLEPFFHSPIRFEELSCQKCVTARSSSCTIAEAFALFADNEDCDKLVLVDEEGAFDRMVLIDDLCEILSHRIEETNLYSMDTIVLSDELDSIDSHCVNNVSILSKGNDFPITLAVLLQRLLLHSRSNCVLVLDKDTRKPIGIVSVRDVWNNVMKRNTSST